MTDKELKDKILDNNNKIADLKKRSTACKPEELDGISAELEKLIESNGELINQRRSLIESATMSNASAPVVAPKADPKEERAKAFIANKSAVISVAEMRSLLLSSGDLATPTAVSGITEDFSKVPAILNDVKVVNAGGRGEDDVSYTKTEGSAAAGTEGSAAAGNQGATFGTIKIAPHLINASDKVSKLIPSETPLDYETACYNSIMKAIRKQVCAMIAGNDATFMGIQAATDKDAASMVENVTLNEAIGANTLRDIVLGYAGDDELDGNATLYLSKATLVKFGAVRGTNEKRALYDISFPNGGSTEGTIQEGGINTRFVIINSLGDKMIYGNPQCYQLDLFSPVTVTVSTDRYIDEGMDGVFGNVLVGGNVIVKNGFRVITQKAAV